MDQRSYEAAQQGLLTCLLDEDHERRLGAFLRGLRADPRWSDLQIDEVAANIREMLGKSEES